MRHRFSALLLAVATLAGVALIGPSQAHAASTTTDYLWLPWIRCQFSTPWTYDDVRWRVDWRHDSAGNRNGKAITYVETRGSSNFKLETLSQVWHSNGAVISSAGRPGGPFSANGLWYTADKMTWTNPAALADGVVALSFSDGDTCIARGRY